MNFFEQQEQARRRTTRLIAYYGLAVLLIIVTLYAVVAGLMYHGQATGTDDLIAWDHYWNPSLFLLVAAGATLLIGGGTVYKIRALGTGGETVATLLGGRRVAPDTSDRRERRLLNVVEEMAIASGTPIPRVYVMDSEDGINAFAAGFSPADAAISVTRGTLECLNRDELQGVIGHEFSHILNGDMRLNIRLIGVLNGILVIAITGYWVFRIATQSSGRSSRRKDSKGSLPFILLGLAMIVIGYIGVFFARLIKSAVSREREYLADASSVQFTRNPSGLAGALKKIGGFTSGSRIQNAHAEEASHLFFSDGVHRSFVQLMATHPPLVDRIRRIDPSFDGTFPEPAPTPEPEALSPVSALAPSTPPPLPPGAAPAHIVRSVGSLPPQALTHVASLLAALPETLRAAVRDPAGAEALVYGLLLGRDAEVRHSQFATLSAGADPRVFNTLLALVPDLNLLPREARLPLTELAIATLKSLEATRYAVFRRAVFELSAADAEISIFEYAIMRLLLRHLDPLFGFARQPVVRFTSMRPVAADCSVLLSALAWFGSDDEDRALNAFRLGRKELADLPELPMLPREQATLEHLDNALDRLVQTTPNLKQQLVGAAAATIGADGRITIDEAEAIRAVADTLDCPIPPFAGSQAR